MWMPMQYQELNAAMASYQPNVLHDNDATTDYYERYFAQKAMSVLDLSCPKDWDMDFMLFTLIRYGFFIVLDTPEYGVIPQAGTVSGVGLFYQPTRFNVNNKLVQRSGENEVDGIIVKMTPDYRGIFDLIHRYAYKMALISSALDQSLINSRLAWALAAKNKKAAQTLKAAMDKILRGEPGVIVDKTVVTDDGDETPIIELMNRNPQDNYITDLLLRDAQTLETRFNREIGIPDITENKGERLTAQEAAEMNSGANAKVTLWVDNLNESFDKVRKLYGIECRAKIRDLVKGGGADEGRNDDSRDAAAGSYTV